MAITKTQSGTVKKGVAFTLDANTWSRPGYTFLGWNTNPSATVQIYTDKQSVTFNQDTTLYAIWRINQYTVTWNSTGGSAIAAYTRKYQEAIGTLPTSTRSEYTLNGWYTTATGGTKVTTTTKVTNNVTYYAHWDAKIETLIGDSNGFMFAYSLPLQSKYGGFRAINDYGVNDKGTYIYSGSTPINLIGKAKRYIKISYKKRIGRSHSKQSNTNHSEISYFMISDQNSNSSTKSYIIPNSTLEAKNTGLVGAEGYPDSAGEIEENKSFLVDLLSIIVDGMHCELDSNNTIKLVDSNNNAVTGKQLYINFYSYGTFGGENHISGLKVQTAAIPF